MARFATLLLASTLTPVLDTGMFNQNRSVVLPAAGIANGDYVPLLTIQRGGRIVGAKVNVPGTLGAAAVVTLALYRAGALVQNLTVASTATAASIMTGATLANVNVLAGDEIVLVCSGAGIATSQTVDVDVHLQH